MPPRLIKLGQIAMVLAMLMACGGHWALLQTVAWTKMIADFSQTGDLKAALVKTFDGCHACKLCKCIKAEKEKEKQQETKIDVQKLTFIHKAAIITFLRPDKYRVLTDRGSRSIQLVDEPPTPPPRRLLA